MRQRIRYLQKHYWLRGVLGALVLVTGFLVAIAMPHGPAQADASLTTYAPWDTGKLFAVGSPGGQVGGGYYGHCCPGYPSEYYAVDINGPGGGNADCDENVRATNGGTVSGVGFHAGNPTVRDDDISYLRIAHGNGYISEYQHITNAIATGTVVARGDVIAKFGNVGTIHCHLHFVVKHSGTSVPPSPMSGVALPVSGGAWVTSNNSPSQSGGTTLPPPVPWNFENLDGDPGSIAGNDANLGRTPAAIEFNTVLHVFYHDPSNGWLRHGWADSTGWHFEVLDGVGGSNGRIVGNVGGTPTSTIYSNGLHVFYYDFGNAALRHAWSSDGTSWSLETLDGVTSAVPGHYSTAVGQTPTAVVTPDGLLQVFYYDAGLGNLRHAWYNTTIGWHFENLDGDAGSIAGWNANLGYDPAAVIHNNTLQLFYYDATNGNLRHAWNTPGTGWHFENLDGDVGSVAGQDADTGRNTAAVIYGGNLQLFYYDASYGNLRHAWSEPTAGWHFENIEGDSASVSHYDSNVGLMPTATVAGNSLQVFYYDSPGGNLRHAWTSPTIPWSFETLDGSGGQPTGRLDVDVGHDPTVVSYYGHAQLFYYDVTNGNLRHSWSQ